MFFLCRKKTWIENGSMNQEKINIFLRKQKRFRFLLYIMKEKLFI